MKFLIGESKIKNTTNQTILTNLVKEQPHEKIQTNQDHQ